MCFSSIRDTLGTQKRPATRGIETKKQPMTIPEITEAIEGASAVLSDMSAEHTDHRFALVIAALGACAESLDRMWEREGAK